MNKVVVLGAGSWGTALGMVLAENHDTVRIWSHRKAQADEVNTHRTNKKYLNVKLPDNLHAYNDLEAALDDVDAIVIVVPTKAIRELCQKIKDLIPEKAVIIHASKGIEPKTYKRISELIDEELPAYPLENIVVLSGPSHAEEVALQHPTTVTVAAKNAKVAAYAQSLFINETFRVYTSEDIVGVELGGALKNIIALGAGISDGLGFGDNAKAALITRGLAEISRLGVKLGANPMTFLGLCGVGDLIVTCTSQHSRNWRAGNLLGKGNSLEEILEEMGMVVEGVRTTGAVYDLSQQMDVEMPITAGIYDVLFNQSSPRDVVKSLMERERKDELSND